MSSTEHVLIANAGTLHVFRTASQLRRHGLLKRCATSLYFRERTFQRLPAGLRMRLLRHTANRRCPDLDGAVETMASPELICLAAGRLGIGSASALIEWRNRRFCIWAAKHCLDDVRLVWAFDTSSHELFLEAKKRGIRCVLEMSIAHPALGSRLMGEYARQQPDRAKCLDSSISDAAMERRRAEIDLADRIMVGSSFVRDSLLEQGISADKITINPYGVDIDLFRPSAGERRGRTGVRFVFVGWFSARKGIYDLLDAWKVSGLFESGAELVLAGGDRTDLTCWLEPLPQGISTLGRVAHSDLPALYRSADVFVFPSLFEGSARVILEAMASGLPIITTPQACDEHCVVDGENGFRVASGDSATLAEKMRTLADDGALRTEMSARSLDLASGYTWSMYGDRCAAACRDLLGTTLC